MATISTLATATLDMAGGGHGTGVMGGGFVGGGFHPLFGLLVLVLVIALLGYVLSRTFRNPTDTQAGGGTESALALLRQRYARGEIDEDEFQSRRAHLEK